MAETITGEQILQAVLQRSKVGLYMANANIGALAAGTVTSVFYLRDTQSSSTNTFRDRRTGLYRPGNATGAADYWRNAGDLVASTGVLDNDANWADTTLGTENVYLLYHKIHCQDFLDALNQAMGICYFENSEPLSCKPNGTTLADAGFQSSATSQYVESDADGGAATTFTKVTTQNSANVWGASIASGRVLNAAANGYIRQRYDVSRGEHIYTGQICRVDVGTSGNGASLVWYDVTNSAAIGTAVSQSEESWQYMWRSGNVTAGSAGTEVFELRHQGIGASDDIYYGAKWLYRTQNRRINLDTKWDSSYKIPELVYGQFHGNSSTTGVVDAHSLDLIPIPKTDYDFDLQRPGANPGYVQFHTDKWFNGPIWIQGRRAYSDLTTFTLALTETTACDLDLIESATRVQMFKDGGTCSQVPNAPVLWLAAYEDFKRASAQFVNEGPAVRKAPSYWPRLAS